MKTAKELTDQMRKRLADTAVFPHAIPLGRDDADVVIAALAELAALKRPIEGMEEIEARHVERQGVIDRLSASRAFAAASQVDHQPHRDIATLLSALKQARAREEGLIELVQAYRAADCPFAQPKQITDMEAKYGHLAPEPKATTSPVLQLPERPRRTWRGWFWNRSLTAFWAGFNGDPEPSDIAGIRWAYRKGAADRAAGISPLPLPWCDAGNFGDAELRAMLDPGTPDPTHLAGKDA